MVADVYEPAFELRVEVGQIPELASCEEAAAKKPNRSFDAPLFIPAGDVAGLGLEAIVPRELKVSGVESDGIMHALEHGALNIVVQIGPGAASKVCVGVDVPLKESGHRRAQVEARKQLARERQHHHEGVELARSSIDVELAEASPVHLRLVPSQSP